MSEQPRIDAYTFGRIEIDGRTYDSDVIILPTKVRGNWRRDEGHVLKPGDLTAVLEAGPDTLVIGQGANGLMKVTDEAVACLHGAGIKTILGRTAQATKAYNERAKRGENVAAALHLTC